MINIDKIIKNVFDENWTVKKLFDLENPSHKPAFTEFKTQAKRKL